MRIGFVSDLHIDFNRQYDFVSVLGQLISDENLDQLVIMGDSANGLQRNLRFYQQLAEALPVPFHTLILMDGTITRLPNIFVKQTVPDTRITLLPNMSGPISYILMAIKSVIGEIVNG